MRDIEADQWRCPNILDRGKPYAKTCGRWKMPEDEFCAICTAAKRRWAPGGSMRERYPKKPPPLSKLQAAEAEIARLRQGLEGIERTFLVAPSLGWKRDGEDVVSPQVQARRLLEGTDG